MRQLRDQAAETRMTMNDFNLDDFLPYLLNNAAEATGRDFATHYRTRYGMSRAQWRIIAHLGGFGALTASDICARGYLEKSKVSRAVAILEEEGLLKRQPSSTDRRAEMLILTDMGRQVHQELAETAQQFQADLVKRLGPERAKLFKELLTELTSDPPE
ncbi:MarR family winged helix-turn-helix transcriptional regulator [Paracoccus aerodenitrificans]|uniref:MarR family winged helix-turn-helix transcriptional regulator n=1 Tax=Paracoccus aerodenitrificans TaxID=3017781 RepID=UPI0022F07DFF|nr:MarR family winged helix-turn-helix transcriptional regulator [Paracoccus aerodenitrificans]WBU63741.1 MarR family winged helix-turn-helix transcriptional regulator [Paracoccus aerodenitrificans]